MHEKIEGEIAVLQGKIERLKSWDGALRLASAIITELPAEWNARVSVGIETGSLEGVLIMVDPAKTSDVAPILHTLALKGWHRKQGQGPDLFEDIGRLSWHLINKNDPAPIVVNAFFWDRSHQVCKKVQVGTKEVPVYEIQCTDTPNA